jgi:hypothetical protein
MGEVALNARSSSRTRREATAARNYPEGCFVSLPHPHKESLDDRKRNLRMTASSYDRYSVGLSIKKICTRCRFILVYVAFLVIYMYDSG